MKRIFIDILRLSQFVQLRVFSSKTFQRQIRVRSKIDMDLKCRENPIVTKLDTPEFKSILSPEIMELKRLFDKYHYEIRIAGGAVRDLLLGQTPTDIDLATVATPQEMKDMFTKEGVRLINMNGEKHGTITPRINDKENFEVTTLRIDMITDGRHAEVEFTTDWKLDANRRDLTINSMFLGFDGSVYDYFFGYEDLHKRLVAFVGDADKRVKEDYLRIMRYFRFYGKIAECPDNHQAQTLEILKRNVEGLQIISGERIWVELKKTLQGKYAGHLLKAILDIGVGPYIGLPEHPNIDELDRLIKQSEHLNLNPMSYLSALIRDIDEATALYSRLKFSSFERDMVYFLVQHRGDKVADRPLLPYERLVLDAKIKQANAVEYVREVMKYRGDETLLKEFHNWDIPRFPISGKVLKENGVPPGKSYGLIISKLKDIWINNEYKQSSDDLIKYLPEIIKEFNKNKKI